MPTLILASSSPARKALLEKLQISFQTISPDIDETPLAHEKPEEIALRLAIAKAKTVQDKFPEAYIIGSDQVIMCGNVRLDKPEIYENAFKQLTLVSGKYIDSYTGLCLLNSKTNKIYSGIEYTRVYFRELSEKTIESYIKKDDPLLCAGSIKAEGLGITLFKEIQTKDPTALLGLPMILLTDFLLAEKLLT
jgi:MAF protein